MLGVFGCAPQCCAPLDTVEQEPIDTRSTCEKQRDDGIMQQVEDTRPWTGSFQVEFDTGDLPTLGLELNVAESNDLIVDGVVPDKLAHKYNQSAEEGNQILTGDRVAAVNGWAAPPSALLKKFQESERVTLTMQHAKVVRIFVEKRGLKFGLKVNHDKKPWCKFLHVVDVNEGAIMEYNRTCGDRGIRRGDRIIEVNNIRGKPETLLRELGMRDQIDLVIIPSPVDNAVERAASKS